MYAVQNLFLKWKNNTVQSLHAGNFYAIQPFDLREFIIMETRRWNAGLEMLEHEANFKCDDVAAYEYNNRNVNSNQIHKIDAGCATL